MAIEIFIKNVNNTSKLDQLWTMNLCLLMTQASIGSHKRYNFRKVIKTLNSLVTEAARYAGRLKIPCGQRPQALRDWLCASITHIKTATGTRRLNNFNPWTVLCRIFASHFIRPITLLSIKRFVDRVQEAKVHSIFLSDRIILPSASRVIMASHPRNILDLMLFM